MNLGKYIKNLLLEQDSVIFPGLGAFISTYRPAQTEEITGIIIPPGKEVTFNPNIRSDDGLLMRHICSVEDISNSEAKKIINQEREKILYQLDKGEKALLRNLGILYKNENQEISFDFQEEGNLLPDAFGLGPTMLWEQKAKIPEGSSQPLSDMVAGEADAEGFIEKQEAGAGNPESEFISAPGELLPEPGTPALKNRAIWLWLLVVVVLLVAAGFFFLTKINRKAPPPIKITIEAPDIPGAELQETLPAAVTADTLKADSVIISKSDTTEMLEPEIDTAGFIVPDPSKFYLIGGSFTKVRNAEAYFQQMKNEGYNPFYLKNKGNYLLVGIGIFDGETEAFGAQYNFLDKFPDSGVWIYIPE